MHLYTIDEVVCQTEDVLQDICTLRSLFEHATNSFATHKKATIALDIFFYCLFPLLFSNLVDGLDLLEVVFGEVTRSNSTIPRYLVLSIAI